LDTFGGNSGGNSSSDGSGDFNNGDNSEKKDVIKRIKVECVKNNPSAENGSDTDSKKKKPKKKRNIWWIKAAIISFVLAAFFSFLSELTASAEQIVVVLLLLAFLILASILFDAIGVAVTSCDVAPIVSMASRKVYGAKTALWLVKNSGTVSSIFNDVIGDIFGIISGACSAAVVVKISLSLDDAWQRWLSILISAIVSALTIGGKAFMKTIAINNSKDFVMFVARIIGIFNKEERKIRKKDSARKKQQKSESKTASANGKDNGGESAKDNPKDSDIAGNKKTPKSK